MKNLLFKSKKLTLLNVIFLLLFSQNALAGVMVGTMDFSVAGAGGAAGIPTLSGTMLIVLSLLLFVVAFRVSKQSGAKSKLFVSLLGVFALSSGAGGLKAISDVHAGASVQQATVLTLTTETTGSVDLFGPNTNYFDNSLGAAATITAININPGFICNIPINIASKDIDTGAPVCTVNSIIPNDAQCQLTCFSLSME